ncbi:MAG: glycosyltransferase family 2 protein [Deltaproteobacteria bacterium]|nr:glycosyltransferase family 2 protein [Deltaproteobacteria bacterium]
MSLFWPKYIIISPVKNEESYIELTIRSVISQTVKPSAWVIVNDGSTDRTREITEKYANEFSWIKLLNLPASKRVRGGHVVKVFHKGFEHLQNEDYEYIVKLDGDVSFEKNFFERIFKFFILNPRLGISSGISHIIKNGRMIEEKSSKGHTLGASKVYKRDCFEEIGGLVEAMGWDGIDEIKARMNGWDAEPVPGLIVMHHRPEGKAHGFFNSGIQRGKGSYFMGYHPLFFMFRSAKCILKSPPDGLGMMLGFFSSYIKKEERINDREFIDFLQKHQLRKLMLLKNKV